GLGVGANLVEVCGGHFVLEAFELAGDLRRQHVKPGRHELADLDHESAKLDGEGVEVPCDTGCPAGTAAPRHPLKSNAWQQDFKPPLLHDVARGEPQDSAISGAEMAVCCHLFSLASPRRPGSIIRARGSRTACGGLRR